MFGRGSWGFAGVALAASLAFGASQAAATSVVRVSVGDNGEPPNNTSTGAVISGDDRSVAFGSWATNLVKSDRNNHADVFLRSVDAGRTTLVSVANDGDMARNGHSLEPDMTPNGRWIAFTSTAWNRQPRSDDSK